MHLFSMSIGSLTCPPFGRSISSSKFFTQPHLHTPMATSLLLLLVMAAFLIVWPTIWTMPTLYPLVISQVPTQIDIRMNTDSFGECLLDERTTSMILLMKFDSSRSLSVKYLVLPRIVMISWGSVIFQTSKRICSALLSGVFEARRANYIGKENKTSLEQHSE